VTEKCANPACENDATTAITLFGQAVGMYCADCNQIVTDRSVAFRLLDKIVAAAGEMSIDLDGGVPLEAYVYVDDEEAGLLHRLWDAQRKRSSE
jgi:hypothetical protein